LAGLTLLLFLAGGAFAASFSISPEVVNTSSGQEFSVDISIDTGKTHTDGADVVLTFNPDKLQALSVEGGESYQNYPVKKIEDGKVTVTALAPVQGPFFSGEARFVTVKFKALSAGQEALTFDFNSGTTTDSNIAAHGTGKDILSEVAESFLYIGGSSASKPLVTTATAGKVVILLIYIIIVIALGFFLYRWWTGRYRDSNVFVPEGVPLDRPPEG